MDIQLNSPGNIKLVGGSSVQQSPVRGANEWTPLKNNFISATNSKRELPPIGLPPSGKRARNVAQQLGETVDYMQRTADVKGTQGNIKLADEAYRRDKILSQAGSRKLDNAITNIQGGGSVPRHSKQGSVTSQILDHIVERGVKERHSRKSTNSNVNGVLAKLNIATDNNYGMSMVEQQQQNSATHSRRLNKISIKNRIENAFNSTQETFKSGFNHYDSSPVAKHYYQDPGFLMTFNGTIP